MDYSFPDELVQNIQNAIDKALAEGANPVAAFDADGTLWATDMGETMFMYQANNNLIDLPEKPWDYYLEMHDRDPRASFLWLAQVNAGQKIDQVRTWAKEALNAHPKPGIFTGQKKIIDHLQNSGVEVYVVTASIKWSVEPGAQLFNIPPENVIGVQSEVVDGVVGKAQDGHITYREGKVKALLEHTGGKAPFFAAGNSEGDLPLLESASHIKFVLNSAHHGELTHESETNMKNIASERGWFFHNFNN